MDVTFSPALRVYAEMWEIAGRRRAADAQFAQALAHIRSGTPDAMAKAFDLFKRSGAHNFTEAQFAAGWCCEHGCGTKRNYPQAIRWYKRAENNVTSDVMSAFDPVGEAENARLRLYFECESYAAAVDALLLLVACGVGVLVWSGTYTGAMDQLLEEGDYTRKKKARSGVMSTVSLIYWLSVTAIFLFYTFGPRGNGQPQYSWFIWAVGGVLYAAVMGIVSLVLYHKDKM